MAKGEVETSEGLKTPFGLIEGASSGDDLDFDAVVGQSIKEYEAGVVPIQSSDRNAATVSPEELAGPAGPAQPSVPFVPQALPAQGTPTAHQVTPVAPANTVAGQSAVPTQAVPLGEPEPRRISFRKAQRLLAEKDALMRTQVSALERKAADFDSIATLAMQYPNMTVQQLMGMDPSAAMAPPVGAMPGYPAPMTAPVSNPPVSRENPALVDAVGAVQANMAEFSLRDLVRRTERDARGQPKELGDDEMEAIRECAEYNGLPHAPESYRLVYDHLSREIAVEAAKAQGFVEGQKAATGLANARAGAPPVMPSGGPTLAAPSAMPRPRTLKTAVRELADSGAIY